MKNENKTLDAIAAEVKLDLAEKVDQWIKSFTQDTSNLDTFPSIGKLEDSFGLLDLETRNIFLNMLSDCLSNIDEKKLISSKKENSDQRG